MGNAAGNAVGLLVIVITVTVGLLFSLQTAAIGYVSIAYGSWILVWLMGRLTLPSPQLPFCKTLTQEEIDTYRMFHLHFFAPAAGQALSAFLNLLRVAGFIWAVVSFFKGLPWIGGLLLAYMLLVSHLVARLDPIRYIAGAALHGNLTAMKEWSKIEVVRVQRENYFKATGD